MVWLERESSTRTTLRKRTCTLAVNPREYYLRDDQPCLSDACTVCTSTGSAGQLSSDGPVYALPDGDTLFQLLSVFESGAVSDVIVCSSSATDAARSGGKALLRRLYKACKDPSKRVVHYDNERCSECRREALEGFESNDALLMGCARRYACHLPGKTIVVISWRTCDASRVNGMVVQPREFFSSAWISDEELIARVNSLLDAIEGPGMGVDNQTRFPEHMETGQAHRMVNNGKLFKGKVAISRFSRNEGTVFVDSPSASNDIRIAVRGKNSLNRALHGDVVSVRVVSNEAREYQHEGTSHAVEVEEEEEEEEEEGGVIGGEVIQEDEEEDELAESSGKAQGVNGEIVAILERAQPEIVACLARREEEEDEELRLGLSSRRRGLLTIPMDKRFPCVRIFTRQGNSLVGSRFAIRIDGWNRESRHPEGHLTKIFGRYNDFRSEVNAILFEKGVVREPFGRLTLQELPQVGAEGEWNIPQEEFAKRSDYRDVFAMSIDPPTTTDVDDCISFRRLGDGRYEVGVHIADVSYFVHQGSKLDGEARARGETVYLVEERLDMLPSTLSSNICSLLEGKDRLAVSCLWQIDDDCDVLSVSQAETVFRSNHKLHYKQAQAIFDGEPFNCHEDELPGDDCERIREALHYIVMFANKRKQERLDRGALEMDAPELRFDANQMEAQSPQQKESVPMNGVVSEMMIQANSAIAQRVQARFPGESLVRSHAPPKHDSTEELKELVESWGFDFDMEGDVSNFPKAFYRLREKLDPALQSLLTSLALRAMSKAKYVSTGEPTPETGFRHFALALESYTHFTSPIRRYADIIVHRQLKAVLQSDEVPPLPHRDLKSIADHLNHRQSSAKGAQERCHHLYLVEHLKGKASPEMATVSSVQRSGFIAFFPRFGVRVAARIVDSSGRVLLPLAEGTDPGSEEWCSGFSCHPAKEQLQIFDGTSGSRVVSISLLENVPVIIFAKSNRVRGAVLQVRLLEDAHPWAKEARSKGLSTRTDTKSALQEASGNSSTELEGGGQASLEPAGEVARAIEEHRDKEGWHSLVSEGPLEIEQSLEEGGERMNFPCDGPSLREFGKGNRRAWRQKYALRASSY